MQILNIFYLLIVFPCVLAITFGLAWLDENRFPATPEKKASNEPESKRDDNDVWNVQYFFEKLYIPQRKPAEDGWNVRAFFKHFT